MSKEPTVLLALLVGTVIGRVLLPAIFASPEQAQHSGVALRAIVMGD